jgi:hypothetical protein
VADPRRTDLTLIDGRSRHLIGSFKLQAQATWILNGLRPKALDWWELRTPAWVAVKGFALTPEVGGLAARDRQGPAFDGAVALVRRSATGGVLAVGGRHIGEPSDGPVRVAIELDGRVVSSVVATPQDRHYVEVVHLPADQLAGDSRYATVTIRSAPLAATAGRVIPVTVEQFDYQPDEGVLFAFASGWHEPELRPATGVTWRWAGPRAKLRVHRRPCASVQLHLSGDMPAIRGARSAQIRIVSGGHELDRFAGVPGFDRWITLPAGGLDDCDVDVDIASSFSFVPHDTGRSADRRELAFRVFSLDALPAPAPK